MLTLPLKVSTPVVESDEVSGASDTAATRRANTPSRK